MVHAVGGSGAGGAVLERLKYSKIEQPKTTAKTEQPEAATKDDEASSSKTTALRDEVVRLNWKRKLLAFMSPM